MVTAFRTFALGIATVFSGLGMLSSRPVTVAPSMAVPLQPETRKKVLPVLVW